MRQRVALSVDKDKRVSELTEAELREVCKESLRAFTNTYGGLCSAMGLSSTRESCADVRNMCLDRLDTSACDRMKLEPLMCDVTVGEMERCMNDSLALYDSLPSINCSTSNRIMCLAGPMIDSDRARELAIEWIGDDCSLVKETVLEGQQRVGYYFEYQTKTYLRTGNQLDGLVGTCRLIVDA